MKIVNFSSGSVAKIVRAAAFMIIFVIIFSKVNFIFRDKTDALHYYPLYDEPENSIDVCFFGTSVVRGAVSPLDLFHDYGIVSFNCANNGQPLPVTYYVIKEAVREQHPQLVVVDLAYIFHPSSTGGDERMHQFTDNMPLSLNKVTCIKDIVGREGSAEYYLPLRIYHQRWKSLNESDFKDIISYNKGCSFDYGKKEGAVLGSQLPLVDRNETSLINDPAKEYIYKIIDYCREQDTELLFINLPSYAYGQTNHGDGLTLQRMWNEFEKIADEEGVPYVNYLYLLDELQFDFLNDMYDWRHCNINGTEKITRHLGALIRDKYQIPDRRSDARYESWKLEYDLLCKEYKRMPDAEVSK